MPKICNVCSNPVFGGGYCKSHQYLRQDKKAPKPVTHTPISRMSKKLRNNTQQYNFQRGKYLVLNPLCKARISINCSRQANDIHHIKGRGIYLLREDTWLPVCRTCHYWIEMHPKEAKELNFSQSRLS